MQFFVGVDLSGPSNPSETGVAWFREDGARLVYAGSQVGADDPCLVGLIASLSARSEVIVGLDGPLSYNPQGGDRERDRELRTRAVRAGLPPGSVMAPTLTKMAYLTLRGMGVARCLEKLAPKPPRIVEVHPAAALALRGADVRSVRRLKKDALARLQILQFLEEQRLERASAVGTTSDHLIAACAAVLAAWRWAWGDAVWIAKAEPPYHPYDFAC